MKTISGIEFASEHNGTDVFRLIELAYEQGQKDVIEQLPSAQPEIKQQAINSSDCIDRRAALDALRKMQTYKLFSGDDMLLIDQAGAQTELMLLPPAQPEVVMCKDCKYWVPGYITDNDDFIPPKCGEWQQMVGHSSDDYCSLAERREDG